MSEELVEIPLWDDWGPLATDPAYLTRVLGLSDDLVLDLIGWGLAYYAKPREIPIEMYKERGSQLAERLREEVARRFTVRIRYIA
jgi:hypothetical protein